MRIAQLAPLWESVPPKAYGGTELVVNLLCKEFSKRGHEVTLFATADSDSYGGKVPIIRAPMRELGVEYPFYYELEAVSKIIEMQDKFDVVHNHLGYQIFPFAKYIKIPVITTLHGALCTRETIEIFTKYKDLPFISISDSQRKPAPNLNYVSTTYNGIDVKKYPFEAIPSLEDPYLAFLGRLSMEKGAHLAIKLAKKTGYKLIMAGKVDNNDFDYYREQVAPEIDGNQIVYIGELGHNDKCELLKNAVATIHPVTWPEPFGLVMAESMACGTPVLALNQGSIPEVILDGLTGFIEENIDDLIERVDEIEDISRHVCREHVEMNFSSEKMADGYMNAYKTVLQKVNAPI